MSEPSANLLSDDAFLDALLDTIIPQQGVMPSAGALSLCATLRRQLADNPLLAGVPAALTALQAAARQRDAGGLAALDAAARTDVVAATMKHQPMLGFLPLVACVVYYQHPRVREALGEPPGAPYPRGHLIEATDESLLRKLRPC
jgi:hypothetical protein